MTGLFQTSSEETRPRSSYPLIFSRDSFSPWTWVRFQTGVSCPTLADVFIYKKRLLLRCIHHFKSDLIYNMEHMRISGIEASSGMLYSNKVVQKFIYFWYMYTVFITLYSCFCNNFMASISALVGCLSSAFIRRIIYNILNVCSFYYTAFAVSEKVGIP